MRRRWTDLVRIRLILLVYSFPFWSNTASFIHLKFEDGEIEFKCDQSMPFYFISGKNGNCDKGSKLNYCGHIFKRKVIALYSNSSKSHRPKLIRTETNWNNWLPPVCMVWPIRFNLKIASFRLFHSKVCLVAIRSNAIVDQS